jgi:hypothetical protein
MEVLNCDFNQIPIEYLDQLCLVLANLPKLREIDLTGNEITLHEYYKYKLLTFSNIQLLDNLDIKPNVRN